MTAPHDDPNPGRARERRRLVAGALVVLLVVAAALWWWRSRPDAPAHDAPEVVASELPPALLKVAFEAVNAMDAALVSDAEAATLQPSLPVPQPYAPGETTAADRSARVTVPAEVQARRVAVYFSGGVMGEIDNCGCAHAPLGGTARRAAWIRERSRDRAGWLALDAGNLIAREMVVTPERVPMVQARGAMLLQAMKAMGYEAMNVGPRDLSLGVETLRKMAKRAGVRLLSANVRTLDDGAPVFTPGVLLERGPLRFGVVGVTSPSPPQFGAVYLQRGLRIDPVVPTVQAAAKALLDQGADVIIVLSTLRRLEVDALLEQVSDVDLVVGTMDHDLVLDLERVAQSWVVDTYTQGKYVGELLIDPGPGGAAPSAGQARPRLVAADLERVLEGERTILAGRLQTLRAQLETADAADGSLVLNEESRAHLQRRILATTARLQRIGLQLSEVRDAAAQAWTGRTLALELHPLHQDMPEADDIRRARDALVAEWPGASERH